MMEFCVWIDLSKLTHNIFKIPLLLMGKGDSFAKFTAQIINHAIERFNDIGLLLFRCDIDDGPSTLIPQPIPVGHFCYPLSTRNNCSVT